MTNLVIVGKFVPSGSGNKLMDASAVAEGADALFMKAAERQGVADLSTISQSYSPPTIVARDAIPLTARRNGLTVYVAETDTIYRLAKDNTNPADSGVWNIALTRADQIAETADAKVMTAVERNRVSKVAVKPGPSRRVIVDSNGNAQLISTKALLDHPYLRGLVASIPTGAGIKAVKVKPGPRRRVTVDANGYALLIVDKSKVNHPDINAIRAAAGSGGGSTTVSRPRIRVASNHGGWNNMTVPQSNGTATGATGRLDFQVQGSVRNPRFVFINGYSDSSGQLNPNGNEIQVAVSFDVAPKVPPVSMPNALGSPISTGGRTAHIIGDAEIVESGVVALGVLSPGTTYNYRTFVSVASGKKWPFHTATTQSSWITSSKTTDPVYGTTVTTGADASNVYGAPMGAFAGTAYAFAAAGVLGEQLPSEPYPVVMSAGDSVAGGAGSTPGLGYILESVIARGGIGYINCGIGGSTLASQVLFGQVPQYFSKYVDHVVFNVLTNDIYTGGIATLAVAQALVLKAFRVFSSTENKIWFGTILPRTASSNTWTDYAGQTLNTTVPSGGTDTYETLRVKINNWMRDATSTGAVAYLIAAGIPAARIGGFFDAASKIEKNSDGSAVVLDGNGQQALGTGGYYITTGVAGATTADGIHPKGVVTAILKTGVPADQFTIPAA